MPRPKRLFLSAVAACLAVPYPAFPSPPTPVAKAAFSLSAELPKGAVVTAELQAGTVHYAASRSIGDTALPPEKVLFEIGSISKVFTSLLLAQAVLEKRVRLNTSLADLLAPQITFSDPHVAAITLEQLATHTSGLPRLPSNMGPSPDTQTNPYALYDRTALYQYLSQTKLPSASPFPAAYSNLGFGLLGDLLASLYDTSWEALIQDRITRPLGMTDTTVSLTAEQTQRLAPPHHGQDPAHNWTFQALAGAGALRSTAADLMRFAQALLNPETTPFPDALKLMLKPRRPFQDAGAQIGLGILIGQFMGQPTWEHDGGTAGYRASLQILPDTATVRLILINNSVLPPQRILAAIARPPTPDHPREQSLTPTEAAAYTGVYELSPQARFTVLQLDDQLWVRLTGQPFFRIHRSAENRFFYKAVPAELEFSKKGDAIQKLTLFQNGRELHAAKSNRPAPQILFRNKADLQRYVGLYDLAPGKTFAITLNAGTLFAELTGQPALPVFETRPGYFEYDVVQAAIEFATTPEGTITALTLHQNGAHHAPRRPDPIPPPPSTPGQSSL